MYLRNSSGAMFTSILLEFSNPRVSISVIWELMSDSACFSKLDASWVFSSSFCNAGSLASNWSRMITLSRSDFICSLRDFVFSICRCFCCSINNSRTLFSADPLKKKYDPKAILKIRKEIIIETSRGLFNRNNSDTSALIIVIFLINKRRTCYRIFYYNYNNITFAIPSIATGSPIAPNYGFVEKQGKVDVLCFRRRGILFHVILVLKLSRTSIYRS